MKTIQYIKFISQTVIPTSYKSLNLKVIVFFCRHCVATHGVHCVNCDTTDIPIEGVPLSDGNEPTISQTAAHQGGIVGYETAIRRGQVHCS